MKNKLLIILFIVFSMIAFTESTIANEQLPYHGTPIEIPGKFEAEDYDLGGEGVAYHDTDDNNQSGEYRTDGVDIGTGGTGYIIGYTKGGEWMEYTIDVAEDGDYEIYIYYASGRPGGGAKIDCSLPEDSIELINSFDLPNTGNWGTYNEILVDTVALTKGEQVLRITVASYGFNLDWVDIKPTGVEESYALNTTFTGSGTITKSPELDSYEPGTEVTLTATPSDGYQFTGWSGDSISEEPTIIVTMNSDVQLEASFEPVAAPTYHLNITAQNGIVTQNPENETFDSGIQVELTATPDQGFQFTGWSGDTISNENPLSISMDSTISITANFAMVQAPYHETSTVIPGKFEAEDYDLGGQGIAYNDTDTTNAGAEYRLDEGVDIGTGGTGYVVAYTNAGEWLEYTIDVAEDGDYDISIYYASGRPGGGAKIGISLPEDSIELVDSFDLPNTGNWDTYNEILVGTVALTKGEQILRIAIADRGYNLDWIEIKETTEEEYVLTTTVSGNGTISQSPSLESYVPGTEVTLTATANEGYEFAGWSGHITSEEQTITVTMNSDVQLEASFIPVMYQLNITAQNGVVSLSPERENYDSGTQIELTAIPDDGYQFTGWSGDITSTNNPLSISMDSTISITANFEILSSSNQINNLQIKVYPNPSKGRINVDIDQNASYTVYNLSGVILKKGKANGNFELDMGSFATGVYLLEIKTQKNTAIKRVVIE